jgi:hypothetical protein
MQKTRSAKKGEPFSIRLSRQTEAFVAEEARRQRRSKSAVVEELTEEASKMRRFPGIAFRGAGARRRAWVIGAGMDVWEIIEAFRDFGSIDRMAAESELQRREIALSLAYAEKYPDEIDGAIAENRRPLNELQELYPFLDIASPE